MDTLRLRPPTQPPQPGEYRTLARSVRDAGLLRKRPAYYSLKVVGNLILLAGGVTLILWLGSSWWQLASAVLMAFAFTQLAFLGHDAGHGQVCRTRRANNMVGLVHANLLTGFSYGWWLTKHNSHHTHCNRAGHDPDIAPGVVCFTPDQARGHRGARRLFVRSQAVLFGPLLLLEAVNLHVSSLRALRRQPRCKAALEAGLLAVHAVAYFGLLVASMDWIHLLVFVVVNQGLFGLYLGMTFATNHTGMPILEEADDLSFVHRQVLTSRNVGRSPFIGFLFGGLDRQIEHHLFPAMPRGNLLRAGRLVREHCERHEIAYTERGVLASYAEVFLYLHRVGEPAAGLGVVG